MQISITLGVYVSSMEECLQFEVAEHLSCEAP